jgi:NTP pyrophosphohydrolases including oxidative damage repair enzymes
MHDYFKQIKHHFKNFETNIIDHDSALESSVLIPLLNIDDTVYVLFQVRSKNISAQPGEISFPGGKKELSDINFMKTAIRETCEELGIEARDIEIIAEMNTFVAPFNIIIHPYLGIIKDFSKININEDEVDHIFLVPLSYFLKQNLIFIILKCPLFQMKIFPLIYSLRVKTMILKLEIIKYFFTITTVT